MSDYYIQTSEGSRGPYSVDTIVRGVSDGSIPPDAHLVHAGNGQALRASELVARTGPARQPQGVPYGTTSAYPQQAYPQAYPQQPYPPQTYPQAGYGAPYPYPAGRQTSANAIASLVLTLVTLATCLPTFIGGIICGLLALKECEPNGTKQGRSMALWGLWLGVAFAVLYIGSIAAFLLAIAAQ